ncbi:hypothetical protein [Streptomyces sp. NBC_01187]|uniref:hypothetical protein n=1 Tax=Streptomyces sp. NBC_01187 TaxID=2903766 RepID=UPI00386EF75F|nr:hypothetical protein OG220_35170 [Streptomyces sp. NBC_01187]
MLTMDAVLEVYRAREFALWEVGQEPPSDRLLALSGELSLPQVGTALAVLVQYNRVEAHSAAELLPRLAAEECLVAPGGLRLHDARSGTTIVPGCCCGLEEWREWARLGEREMPWMGHDPDPDGEFGATTVSLWPDEGRRTAPAVVPFTRLRGLLEKVRSDLTGFMWLAGEWSERQAPGTGAALRQKLDEAFHLSAPFSRAR